MTNRRVPCPEIKLEEAKKYVEEIANKVLSKNKSPKEKQAVKNDAEQESLDSLREQYEEKFGVEVPNRYKNDVEWIRKKLLDK